MKQVNGQLLTQITKSGRKKYQIAGKFVVLQDKVDILASPASAHCSNLA